MFLCVRFFSRVSEAYFISASALPFVVSGDSYAFCYDALAGKGSVTMHQ